MKLKVFLSIIYLVECSLGVIQDVVLEDDISKQIAISTDLLELRVANVSLSTTFVLFQAHAHTNNLTISMQEEIVETQYTNGTDIGVVVELEVGATEAKSYVLCPTCEMGRNITIVVMATFISNTDPVPGACSFEFPLENDPNIHIPTTRFVNSVQFQFANFGRSRKKSWTNCENKSLQKQLTHDVYQLFFRAGESTESYFLQSMEIVLNRTEFLKEAKKVDTLQYGSAKPQVDFASYYGHGVAYAVLVTQHVEGAVISSSYVPVITYNCDYRPDSSCDMRTVGIVTTQVVSTFLAVAGLILCFLGHRMFKTSMFLFGTLAFTLIFLTILFRFSPWSLAGVVLGSLFLGFTGGLLWLAVWCFLGIPILSVIIPGLVMGYLLTSIIFVATPLDDLAIFTYNLNYGLCFACGVLIPCFLLMVFSRVLHIMACTMVGSFLIVFAFDQYIFGNLQRIITIAIKKSASNEFLLIHNTWPPFSTSDIILAVTWVLLCLGGGYFQYRRERRRPHFPPCPYRTYLHRKMYQPLSGLDTSEIDQEQEPLIRPSQRVPTNERDPFDSDRVRSGRSLLNSRAYDSTSTARRQPQERPINDVSGFYEADPNENRQIIDPM